jgi:membrane protein implicated in regulation of membrane protease activity
VSIKKLLFGTGLGATWWMVAAIISGVAGVFAVLERSWLGVAFFVASAVALAYVVASVRERNF